MPMTCARRSLLALGFLFTPLLAPSQSDALGACGSQVFKAPFHLDAYIERTRPLLGFQKNSGHAIFRGRRVPFWFQQDSVISDDRTSIGLWGHERRRLKRVRGTWHSDKKMGKNYAGNALNFLQLLGPEAAYFFGFELISDHELWVPSSDEVNAAIERFNIGLDEADQIPIRFYDTDEGEVDDEEFLRQTVRGRRAFARRGFFQVHDANYHLAELAAHPAIFRALQEKAQAALDEREPQRLLAIADVADNVDGLGNLALANDRFDDELDFHYVGELTGLVKDGKFTPVTIDWLSRQRLLFVRERAQRLLRAHL